MTGARDSVCRWVSEFQKSPALGQEGEGKGPPQRLRGKPRKTSSASGLTPASKGAKEEEGASNGEVRAGRPAVA